MSTFEPPDAASDAKSDSVTTAMFNAHIETLTTSKDMVKATLVKEVFESVIAILTLVRVRLLALFPFLHPLIGDTARTR